VPDRIAGGVTVNYQLEYWLNRWLESKTAIRKSTVRTKRKVATNLIDLLGPQFDVRELKASTGRDLADFLRTGARKVGIGSSQQPNGLSEGTVQRRLQYAREIGRFLHEEEVLPSNPLENLRTKRISAKSSLQYVNHDRYGKVLDTIPTDTSVGVQYRAIWALSRCAGLRGASEFMYMEMEHVTFGTGTMDDPGRIQIISPKTEHAGKPSRKCPMFPGVRGSLAALLEIHDSKDPYLFQGDKWDKARERGEATFLNLGTTMSKYVSRAGLDCWPRLFVSNRSSSAIDLAGLGFLHHQIAEWLGNSTLILLKHYLSSTMDDFARAAGVTADESRGGYRGGTPAFPDGLEGTG
jgi:site-specific recombinase XerC